MKLKVIYKQNTANFRNFEYFNFTGEFQSISVDNCSKGTGIKIIFKEAPVVKIIIGDTTQEDEIYLERLRQNLENEYKVCLSDSGYFSAISYKFSAGTLRIERVN
jgi:hypothetical protein